MADGATPAAVSNRLSPPPDEFADRRERKNLSKLNAIEKALLCTLAPNSQDAQPGIHGEISHDDEGVAHA